MTSAIKNNKSVEMTVNLKKLARKASWRYKAPKCISYLRKLVRKQFRSENEVLIAPDVNKYIWTHGMRRVPTKIRVKIERAPSNKNPQVAVFRICMVEVNTFKGLSPQSYEE